MSSLSFFADLLQEVSLEIAATIVIEPTYSYAGCIHFRSGKISYFRGGFLDINAAGSVSLVRDKDYTKYFLTKNEIRVPKGKTVFSDERNEVLDVKSTLLDGLDWLRKQEGPVVLKPNSGSQGNMVYKIQTEEDYFYFAPQILNKYPVMLMEEWCEGRDIRIVVYRDQLQFAYERIPLHIEGDGISSIKDLLDQKKEEFQRLSRTFALDAEDERITHVLQRNDYSLATVLKKNQLLRLLDNANLSTGGTSIDHTKIIHPNIVEHAIHVSNVLGLTFCGVDMLILDVTTFTGREVVLEVNAGPGLQHFSSRGAFERQQVKEMYKKILLDIEAMR